ncbi:MAG: hypothetical protein KC421_12760, partial [Anaerolineales bacterium]|nr:hypothetical protein [Anaerolineales bacterium]
MTLEFEKLTQDLEKMAAGSVRRQARLQTMVAKYHQTLNQYATDWEMIETALVAAKKRSDPKFYRSARPFSEREGLNTAV